MTTRQVGEPGSRGRTCATSRALSSTTSIRFPASRLRVQAQLAFHRLREPVSGDLQGIQEHAHGLGGRHRCLRRAEATQVHEQLAIGELSGHLMRPLHGQRGFPHLPRFRRSL